MINPVQAWQARAALKAGLRAFFTSQAYLEIDTPLAVLCPGTELHLNYFKTEWQDFRGQAHPLWLRSSPELHMKQALAAGAPRLFQLAPCFRNGGELSPWHHPEFTMLEWYEVGIGFEAFIAQTIALLTATHQHMLDHSPLKPRWQAPKSFVRLTVAEAFDEFAGLRLLDQDPELAKQAKAQGVVSIQPGDDFETAFFKILLEKVEPHLTAMEAVVLYDYPPSQAALARVEGSAAKRFEIYLKGVELCNGFHELLDPEENRSRIRATNLQRQALGKEVPGEDLNFYQALERGISDCCGNALGFDRWLALLLGADNLDGVIPFRNQQPYQGDAYPG